MALYTFGLSQEDERTDAAALELSAGDRVLCIAGAGETPLSLLALGAASVTAVDIDPAQLHLTAFKLAAILALPRERALRFLGFFRASPGDRCRDLEAVLPLLPPQSRAFWKRHRRAALRGAIGQASFERYVRWVVGATGWLFGRDRVEGLFTAPGPAEQASHFDRRVGVPAVRLLFRLAFDPRVFARGRLHASALEGPAGSFGARYFERFRAFCTGMPARDNFFLQFVMLGELLSCDAAPACFSPAGIDVIRARADRLRLVHADVSALLAAEPEGSFDKIQLSNIPDWMPPAAFETLLETAAGRVARSGRLVYRSLRAAADVPAHLAPLLRVDRALGTRLAADERCPFWVVVPAEIGPS